MDPSDLLEDVRGALGVGEMHPLRAGGQKWVFSSELEQVACVVKVVPVPPGAQAEVVLERARREVELLAIVESDFVVRVLTEAVEVGIAQMSSAGQKSGSTERISAT